MKKHLKTFLLRGAFFGGFGPLVVSIVYFILEHSITNFSISGTEAALAIFSTYILAFVHAGASVFNQIEEWPITKSLLFHFLTLYVAYTLCYLINAWIPFDIKVLLLYTLLFIALYGLIWIIVIISIKRKARRFNEAIGNKN